MKTCIDCHQTHPFTSFTVKKSCKDGYEPRCKKCRSIKYNKDSPYVLAKKVYNSQCTSAILRKMALPDYSLQELLDWLEKQPNFSILYKAWKDSGYLVNLAPSADRLDNNQSYVLANLQLVTWEENRKNATNSRKNNELLVNHRKVSAYHKTGELYKTYLSMAEAVREFGGKGTHSYGISSVCNGVPVKDGKGNYYTPKTYKGFIWKWA